jgi:signal transduction histidine kinase
LSYVVFALAWSAAIGHMYGASLFGIEPASHTLAAGLVVSGFLTLSMGLVAVHAEHGLPALLTQGNLTAFQFRTLLPTVLLLPFLVGLLVIHGMPFYGPQMAVALTAIGSALIAALILFVSTGYLRSAEEKLRDSLEQMNEARHAAESANAARDKFVSFVSHELRAPLTSAHTWVELMDLNPDDKNLDDGIKVLKDSIATLVRLIDDLGDVSRLTSGRLAIEPERIDLNELLRNACMETNPRLAEANIYLDQELPDKPCVMMGDPVRIQQVFRNLLSNAGKYVPAGGWVKVALNMDDHLATVVVEDNGTGLTAEQCSRIFEPFYRTETNSQGLGVGLAIAKAIMKAHDGSIEVSSGGVDEGCRFTLRLPLISSSLHTSMDLTAEH